MEVTEIVRSSAEPSLMPARTPKIKDSGITTPKVARARYPVLPSRSHNKSDTGVLKRTDSPKSPLAKSMSQDA